MKFRYYLRGLGAGMIITAIILMIAGKVNGIDASKGHDENESSKAEGSVIAYTTASDNGESTSEETEKETTAESLAATKEDITKNTETAGTTQSVIETTAKQETTTAMATAGTVNSNGKVQVYIKDVYYAYQAGDILYNAGVITDKEGFNNYINKTVYATKIKEGVYEITPGESYENIAKIITQTK
ncbi:MAG: hypothetical protein Q4F06_07020 [Eubacteriales bacterium]|nr:hypothetical protein [Eubacteriales bacterium]